MPDLRMKIVFLKEAEGFLMLAPEGKVFDSMFPVLQDFFLEFGDISGSPVVGTAFEAEPGEHCRSRSGTASGGIERHDAPRDEIVLLQVGWHFDGETAHGRQKNQTTSNDEEAAHAEG